MAAAETARLIASLELQDKNFTANSQKILSGLDRIDQRFSKSTSFWKQSVSTAFGVGLERVVRAGVRGVFGALQGGIQSLQEQGVVVAQTNAVIKSTGAVSHVSAGEVRELSEAIEAKTAIDDKQVQAGANLLLTFTNIRNETGKGNDIFTQSVSILADMSTALGTDMPASAIQLGKALNDPIKGITALRRVGVAFDATQEKQIKQFVKEGKVIEAQRLILAELNKEFGGSGAAFAETDAGKAAKFADAIEDIQKSFATALLPTISKVRDALTGFLSDPATMGQAQALGETIANIFNTGNIQTAATAMTTAASAVSQALSLFGKLPPEIQALAVGALALKKITGIGPGDLFKAVTGDFFKKGGSPSNPLFVSDVSGGLGGPGGAAGKLGILGALFPATAILGLGTAIGTVIVDKLGGPTADTGGEGREVNIAGLDLILGRNEAALVRAESDRRRHPQPVIDNSPDARQERSNIKKAAEAALVGVRRDERQERYLTSIDATMTALQTQTHADLEAAIGILKTSSDPKAIAAAIAQAITGVKGGAGSAATTRNLVADLKEQLKAAETSGNKELAGQIRDAIKQIEPFAKGRQWQQEQIQAARDIVASTKTAAEKTAALKGIEQDLLSHQRTMAGDIVAGLLDVVNAVQNIKLPAGSSPRVNKGTGFVIPGGVPLPSPTSPASPQIRNGFVVNANVTVSSRDVTEAQNLRNRWGPTPTEAGAA